MPAIWVGAALVASGLVVLVAPRVWRRLRGGRPPDPTAEPDAPERREPVLDLDPEENGPGVALIAMGTILLLAGTFA
jgi:hypothetical protein